MLLPSEDFDPSVEQVVRFAGQLARLRPTVRGWVDPRARALRVLIETDPAGRLRYSVEVPMSAAPRRDPWCDASWPSRASILAACSATAFARVPRSPKQRSSFPHNPPTTVAVQHAVTNNSRGRHDGLSE